MYLELIKNGRDNDSQTSDSLNTKTVERDSKSPSHSPSRIQSIDFSKATKTGNSNNQILNMIKTPKSGDLTQKIEAISRENQELK